MGGAGVLAAVPTMTQIKFFDSAVNLERHSAAQTGTAVCFDHVQTLLSIDGVRTVNTRR
jgi:hypothetical protein